MANLRANKIYGTSGPDANGSALFNGTDYLTASNAAAFRLNQGSGADLTIEAWIYAKSVGTQFTIASLYVTSGNKRSYHLYVNSDGELKFNYSGNGTAGNTSVLNAGVIPTNQWIHVAVTHDTSATTVRLFKNGVLKDDDTSAHATWYANTDGDFVVGLSLDGFISNLHINKGTCKYTASFDPYKQPIEVETNTSVLCCNSSTDALNDDKSNTFVQTASGGVKPTTDMPFSRSDAGVVFDGDTKVNSQGHMYFPTGDTAQRSRGRGLIIAGYTNPLNIKTTDYVQIQSLGNAIKFGDATALVRGQDAAGSSTRAVSAGGFVAPAVVDTIEYFTTATTSNAVDFGNLVSATSSLAGFGNETRGIWAGGYAPTANDKIDYVTIATTGNAADFGNCVANVATAAGCASPTRGVFGGGYASPAGNNTLQYVTIATTGNATDFGDLTAVTWGLHALSSNTRGVFGGGVAPSITNTISYVTIASTGNATDFGDLIQTAAYHACTSNGSRGIFAGGDPTSTFLNTIQYVTISTTGNSSDFGDMTTIGAYRSATSDSHGGLS